MTSALLVSGLVIYIVNYTIGWLLHFGIITMTKRTHQIFFAAIIANLILLLFFLRFPTSSFIFCLLSLAAMFILPLGRKGGVYHRIISSAGLVLYLLSFFKHLP